MFKEMVLEKSGNRLNIPLMIMTLGASMLLAYSTLGGGSVAAELRSCSGGSADIFCGGAGRQFDYIFGIRRYRRRCDGSLRAASYYGGEMDHKR